MLAALLVSADLVSPAFQEGERPIVVRGTITKELAAEVSRELQRHPRPLVLESRGGNEVASLDLARAVKESGVAVYVENACLSGCVIVALSASTVVMKDDAVFGLHGSALAFANNYKVKGLRTTNDIESAVAKYNELFDNRQKKLFYCAAEKIGLSTTRMVVGGRIAWASRYSMWVPRDEDISRFGFSLERVGKRTSFEDVRDNAFKVMLGSARANIRFGLEEGKCP